MTLVIGNNFNSATSLYAVRVVSLDCHLQKAAGIAHPTQE